jgi:hypothetical protein
VTGAASAYDLAMRLLLALCLLASPAFAQEGQATDDDAPGTKVKEDQPAPDGDEKPAPEEGQLRLNDGKYGGVSPGAQHLPPRAPRMPVKKGPQRLTWSGFQVIEGTPTVFLELTGTPDFSVGERPGELTVTLKNTIVPVKNNKRPLRVEAFNTGVKNVETSTHGRDTRVTIHVKDPVAHKERVVAAAGGFQMLLIELTSR